MKTFALIGAAGYIAPRHMRAIKDNHGDLVAAVDKNDSVGVIDNYFSQAAFFTEFERFDRHIDKLRRRGEGVDFISVCSPNYLHDSHIRFGLRSGCDVICEKPIVLNPWNLEALGEIENECGQRVYSILQLRHHNSIMALRERVLSGDPSKVYDIDLTYITSRGIWYYASWKGDRSKSGGISTNIGVHFFDALTWIFGDVVTNHVHVHTHDRAAGYLELKNARIRWFLSIDADMLPEHIKQKGQRTYRSLIMDGKEVEFSEGFADLHSESYRRIIDGKGFGLDDCRNAIQLIHDIRHKSPIGLKGDYHPFASLELKKHPFGRK